jgi:hypothetical protein
MVPDLVERTKKVNTGSDFVVQQLTVQGRASDNFKLVALLLLMHSDNLYDWNEPSYETAWGSVAPMIHDGGNVDYSLNPVVAAGLEGRTDFLSRVVFNDQVEQDEDKLLTEAKAWQRLKLAHDTKTYYEYPYLEDNSKIPAQLDKTWFDFQKQTARFMDNCNLGELLAVKWFESNPRITSKITGYGDRYEGDFERIKPGLLKLNDMMEKFPDQLKKSSGHILKKYTNQVDEILGI